MRKKQSLLILIGLLILATGCKKDINFEKEVLQNEEKTIEEKVPEEIVEIDSKDLIDLSFKPNEAGDVMILMYHNIGEVESEWTRTPENFRKDLLTLYEKGYRPISLKDYVNNNIDIAIGMTPVVITFDDGNENNFRIIKDENNKDIIDPNCAVGILEDFNKDYPDFKPTATFFVFGNNPFRQPEYVEYKLKYLIDNGYDIGNHTIDHRGMRKVQSKEVIEEAIGKQIEVIRNILPDYTMNTYALCYGERPKMEGLDRYLNSGIYEGVEYNNIAILNVGWNPAPSPTSTKFNPLSLPRIRASEMKVDNVGIYNWIEHFDKNPEKKFISDGYVDIITVPEKLKDYINIDNTNDKELYIYND